MDRYFWVTDKNGNIRMVTYDYYGDGFSLSEVIVLAIQKMLRFFRGM